MTTPSNPEATTQASTHPGGAAHQGYSPYGVQQAAPAPGYGYGYGPRPRRPYGPALGIAAFGFLIEAIGSFFYWPVSSYSQNLTRIAVICTGVGFLTLALAALVAVASRPN